MRRWLFWLLMIAFIWTIVSRSTEIQELVQTLAQGQWQWVLVAVLLTAAHHWTRAGVYQSAFHTVGVRSRVREILPVMLASLFVNVAVPIGGAGGAALFVDDAARRSQPAIRVAAGTLLFLIADFSAFTLVLVWGFTYLFLRQDLQVYQLIGALVLLVFITGLAGILLLGLTLPGHLLGLLSRVQQPANRLAAWMKRPAPFRQDWAEITARELNEAAAAIAARPRRLARTILVALVSHLVNLANLYVLFWAFHQSLNPGALVAGYAVGILFWVVSITPQGIGIVEGVMTLVYTSLGVPTEKAAIVALAFRGLVFWLPLGLGFFQLQRLRSFQTQGQPTNGKQKLGVMAVMASLLGLAHLYTVDLYSLPAKLWRAGQPLLQGFTNSGRLLTAVAGFALLFLAAVLIRKR